MMNAGQNNPTNFTLVRRLDFLSDLASGASVLHLGCTAAPYTKENLENGNLLHARLEAVADHVTGVDNDEEGIKELKDLGFHDLVAADLERLEDCEFSRRYDLIIAGEVIEHLNDPGKFLRGLQKHMQSSTRLVITTINAYCGMRFFQYALRGKGGTAEPVHPDHVAYYSYRTLKLLVERNGYILESFFFYDLGKEDRKSNRTILNLINDVCVAFSKQLADGIVAVCRKKENT
jgi:SAM-dependent methyltransferase